MSGGRYVPPKDTFPNFESRYEATGFSPQELARALTVSSRHYEVISGRAADESQHVTQALAGLNILDSSTTYSLLLALFKKRASGAIDSEQLARAIEILRGFILRRFVCGESSRGYGQMFVRALGGDDGNSIKTVETYLLDRGWPDDHQFEAAFVEFPLYQRGYTREILETLERARGHKEPADLQAAQVEHVLPQTLSDAWHEALGSEAERIHTDWLHRPGNLTLSGYNQELWNHPFKTKRERYAQSNVVLTRELADYDHWGEAEIRERGRFLAIEAAQIWIGPKEQVPRPEPETGADDDSSGRFELRRRFWSGLSDFLAAERPDLASFEVRPSWTIRLTSGIRHVGIELRLGLRHNHAGIDIWFWREASLPIWEHVRTSSNRYDELVAATWHFEQVEGRPRARMFLDQPVADLRNEASWPEIYRWIGEKLSLVYEGVVPKLREEMDLAERG